MKLPSVNGINVCELVFVPEMDVISSVVISRPRSPDSSALEFIFPGPGLGLGLEILGLGLETSV